MKKIGLAFLGLTLLSGCMTRMEQNTKFWNDHFVFVSTRGGDSDIYLSDMKGQNVRALTQDSFEDASPRVMIDGRVVFASKRTGTWQIYTMNWNGTNVKAVTSTPGVNNYSPSPSPDGRIVYLTDEYVKPQIMSVNTDGSDRVRLSKGDFHYANPLVGDDGHIYFTSSRSSKWDVWKMAPDGSFMEQLTHSLDNIQEIALIPSTVRDAAPRSINQSPMLPYYVFFAQPRIVFSKRTNQGNMSLYRINLDGSDMRMLSVKQKTNDRNPVLLPSGEVLFTSDRTGSTDVWAMSPDGQRIRPIISHPAYDSTT